MTSTVEHNLQREKNKEKKNNTMFTQPFPPSPSTAKLFLLPLSSDG
jgi:hypothetical protein